MNPYQKNYNMKLKLCTAIFLITHFFTLVNAQTTLWGGPTDPNSTFTGGMGAWTTTGINSSDPAATTKAIWTWSATGDGKNGAYWSGPGIASPSGITGAMIFNSDFLDNGGSASNERKGTAPGPHTGALVSPSINCNTFNSVALKFNQYFRNYDAKCYVDVSTNDGATWTSRFEVNNGLESDDATSNSDVQIIDISAAAAGNDSVKFRFVFDGDYYFWIVDDVSLISLPDNDLRINSTRYPARAYAQPISQICNDAMKLGVNVSNVGATAQSNGVKLSVAISYNKAIIHNDEMAITSLAVNDDNKNLVFNTSFVPSNLAIGKYYVTYTLRSNNTDYNMGDNSAIDSFEVTGFQYAMESKATSGIRAGNGQAYSVGALYETSDCWNINDKFRVSSVDMSLVSNSKATLNNYNVDLILLKVKPEVLRDFSNFDKKNGENSSSVEQLSLKTFVGTNQANYDIINIALKDAQGVNDVNLDKSSRYIVLAKHAAEANRNDPDTWHFTAVSNAIQYPNKDFQVPAIDNQGDWLSWSSNEAPYLRLNINVNTKVDEKPLADDVFRLKSNPVSSALEFNLRFNEATDANLTIFNQEGKVLHFQSYEKSIERSESLNVSSYTNGLYYARISTDLGTKTLAFIKQ